MDSKGNRETKVIADRTETLVGAIAPAMFPAKVIKKHDGKFPFDEEN